MFVIYIPVKLKMKNLDWHERFVSHHWRFIIIIILLVGFLIRLYGINFALPYINIFDETYFVDRAFLILLNRDLNPHWFGPPATTIIYMLAGIYTMIFLIGSRVGVFASFEDFKLLYYQDPTIFYLSGRLLSAVFGTAIILLTYLIGEKIFKNKTIGLMAAVFMAITPWHVEYSKFVRMDTLMTFLILIAFWYCLNILEENKFSSYILASFFTGLAIVTKYPAVVFIPTIILAYLLSKGWQRGGYLKPIVSAIACFLAAFLASPFLFLDFQTTLADVSHEARPQNVTANGEGFIENIIWYWQHPLTHSFTFYGLLLVGIGMALCLASKQKDRYILISFPIFFLLFISSLSLRWHRWVIPIIPFGCILLAYTIYRLAKWVENRLNFRIGFLIVLIFCGMISVPLFNASILHGQELSGLDTRAMAREWMLSNIPAKSSVLVDSGTLPVPVRAFNFFEVDRGTLSKIDPEQTRYSFIEPNRQSLGQIKNLEDIKRKNIEYIVFSAKYDQYMNEKERYPNIVKTYEKIIASTALIYESKQYIKVNPEPNIRIYKVQSKNNSKHN